MPATTALDIITNAFDTTGIFRQGQSIPTPDASKALRRLNQMVRGWSLQSLTIPVVARQVFPLTADVGVYTIGPGGDFDTTRPNELEGAGILLNSQGTPASVTSITRSGSVATVTQTSHGGSTGQSVTIAGANEDAYNGTFTITVTGVNTYTYLVGSAADTPATGTITASFESTGNSVVEVPRALLTDDAWERIQIKGLTSAQFTDVYYNPTFSADLGTITLWPIPNTAVNSLVIYRLMQLPDFVDLTTSYFLPAGAEDAMEYGLARRLLTPYGVIDQETVGDIIDMARSTLATFKRGNMKLSDLGTDPALTKSQRGGYNILTGTGGN